MDGGNLHFTGLLEIVGFFWTKSCAAMEFGMGYPVVHMTCEGGIVGKNERFEEGSWFECAVRLLPVTWLA